MAATTTVQSTFRKLIDNSKKYASLGVRKYKGLTLYGKARQLEYSSLQWGLTMSYPMYAAGYLGSAMLLRRYWDCCVRDNTSADIPVSV